MTATFTPATANTNSGYTTFWTDGALPFGSGWGETRRFRTLSNVVFTAPVDPAGGVRVLKLWLHSNGANSTFNAHVGSDADTTLWTTYPTGATNTTNFYGLVRLYYSSTVSTDLLTVTWTATGTTLEPSSVALGTVTAPLAPASLTMPSGTVGVAYNYTMAGQVTPSIGGALTFTSSNAPAWMTLAANGTMTGTPTAAGPVAFTVSVAEAGNATPATVAVSFAVNASGSPVTKIAFVRDRKSGGYDLTAYKAFLESTVYPGRTMVYYDTPGRYTILNWDANKAELIDSDLIIFTNDITTGQYDWQQWNQLNVPIMMHNQALVNNSYNMMGWENGANTFTLRYGPNSYKNEPGNQGWMIMYHLAGAGAGTRTPAYYTPNTVDPFYAGLPTTPYAAGDNVHGGPQLGCGGIITGNVAGDTLTAGQYWMTSVWFQVFNGARAVGTTSNYDVGGGRMLGLPMDASNPLGPDWYNKGMGYNPAIVRWNQGDTFYRWSVPAPSRRMVFPSGSVQTADELTTLFNDPNGAALSPVGQLLLKNGLLGLYNPTNGRRPVVVAGAAQNVYFSGAETQHDFTVSDATYTDPDTPGATGTYTWTVTAAKVADQSSASIVSGGTTLTPTIRFTKTGTFTLTLKAVKSANLDAVYATKVVTVAAAAPTVTTWPTSGLAIETLTGMPVVVTFNQPVAPGASMTLTVNGSAPLALTNSGDNMKFTCDAIALGAVLPTTNNTAVPFVLNTSTVTSLANGTAFGAASYTWNAIYNATAHAAFRVRVFNGTNTGSTYTTPVNALLTQVFGPYTQIQWVAAGTYSVAGGLLQSTWDDFQAADLILAGASIGNNSLNGANGWSGAGTNNASQLNTPVIMMRYNIWTWDSWASNTGSQWCTEEYRQFPWDAIVPSAPLFTGVTNPTHVTTIPLQPANLLFLQYPNVGTFDEMQSNTTAAPNSGTGWELADVNSYSTARTAQYWPKNTALWPASTVTHVARRGFWGMGPFTNWTYLNADGVTVTKNFLKMVAPVPGAPAVVSTNPVAGAQNAGKLITVSITTDLSITSPGNLTVTGSVNPTIGTYSSPVASNENRTWTWTIPNADWVGKPNQTLTFSADMTGVTETESGNAYPYQGTSYVWRSTYNVGNLASIVVCTNRTTGMSTVMTTFLQDVYPGASLTFLASTGTNGYTTVPWSASTQTTLQSASLVIMDGSESASSYSNPMWNLLTTPMVFFGHYPTIGTGFGMEPTTANTSDYSNSLFVTNADSLIFKGVTIATDGTVLEDTVSGNMNELDYGTPSLTPPNGVTFAVRGNSTSGRNRPVMQYWPANTAFYSATTKMAAGPRMVYTVDQAWGGDSRLVRNELTANGAQMVRNVLRFMASPSGQPTVASTDPGATVAKKIRSVTVTFDRHVSTPGALTIKDASNNTLATVATPTTSYDGGIRWTYAVSASAMVGVVAQNLSLSINMTGVYETESGLQLPFASTTYSWTSAYNPSNLGNIVFLTTKTTGMGPGGIYDTFLKSVYGPNTTVNFLPGGAWQVNPWPATTVDTLQTADLIIMDYNSSTGIDNTQWNSLTTPLLLLTTAPARAGAWNWAPATNNWQTDGMNTTNPDPMMFENVSIISGRITTNTNSPLLYKLEYGTAAAPTYYGTNFGFYRTGDEHRVMLHYWPANTTFFNGSSMSAAGPRMFFSGVSGAYDNDSNFVTNNVTANAVQLYRNVLRWMSWPVAQPSIVSVNPADATLFTSSAPRTISVTFDRPVTGVSTLLVNGQSAGTPVGSQLNTVWTWTVPLSTIPNIACTVNASMTKTGIVDSSSGLQLPLGSGTYDWSFTYDPTQFRPTIALVSNSDTSDSHSAYVSFLTNDCYSTTLYTRSIVVEDVPGKYYNMSSTTAATLQQMTQMAIVMPYQVRASLTAKGNWNGLSIPVMVHKVDTAVDWGFNGSTSNYTTNDNWDAWFYGYWGLTAGYSDWTMVLHTVAGDELLAGTNANVNAFGGDDGGILFSHTVTGLRGLSSDSMSYTLGGVGGYGQSYRAWGWFNPWCRWQAGNVFWGGGSALAKRVQMSLGPQASTDNYGRDEAANFFGPTGAHDLGGKQVLRNALRWMMNPDSFPFPVKVKSTSPALVGGTAGVLGPITVVFSKPVSGVLNTDLTWNASTSGVFYTATAATPSGTPPTDTWTFTGAWQANAALIGQYQTIYMDLNPLDSATHSHIISVDGDGCPRTQWAWSYQWVPAPASVPAKQWSLYQ